jgi:hypothetical protein
MGTLAGMGRAFQPYSGGVTVKMIALMEVMRTDVTVSALRLVSTHDVTSCMFCYM